MSLINNNYVYAHIDPHNKKIFYIGNGSGDKAYSGNIRNHRWTQRVASLGHEYKVEILEKNLGIKEASLRASELIRKIGRIENGGTLINYSGYGDIEQIYHRR